ncbi:B-type cyclin [Coemansia sp. RSA 552]|nr:B-type cyclin [Coemansia sp. RSA 552]
MAQRSRIPVRRAGAATDENKGAAVARGAKDAAEPVKAMGKPRPLNAASMGKAAGKPGAVGAKAFGAPAARPRNALGEISNVKAQGIVTKLTKPGDVAAKLQAKPLGARAVRPANVTAKPVTAGTRLRVPANTAKPAVGSSSTATAVLGTNRPISKPAANFGMRRTRATASSAAPSNTNTSKRARSAAASAPVTRTTSMLGKHTRSGRATRVAQPEAAAAQPEAAAAQPEAPSSAAPKTSEAAPKPSEVAVSPVTDSGDETAVGSVELNRTASPASVDDLAELKFVEVDTIDYALEHVGLSNETPIQTAEIDMFEADVDAADPSIVAEFSDDIFGYLRELEVKLMPNHDYVSFQSSITWQSRAVIVEWVVQLHERFNLLPETLFLSVNFIDRMLSHKDIPISKLQLVGIVCLLLACKYEEMYVPSIKDLQYHVDNCYSEEELLMAERYALRILNFDLGWPGPLSFLRRISKADEYDAVVRTVAKYLIEVTLIDERFLPIPSSKVAAVASYLSLRMLKGEPWSRAHAFYAGYFESELMGPARMLLEQLMHPSYHRSIFFKYAHRRFMRVSKFVHQWVSTHDPRSLLTPTEGDLHPVTQVPTIQQQSTPPAESIF